MWIGGWYYPEIVREPDMMDDFEKLPGVKVLMCHKPEHYIKYLRSRTMDLVVAGHAHGGQFRAFGRGLYAPGQGIFPRYTSGLYDLDGAKLAVCRGLGNHAFVPRINNPPHMMLLILQRG